MWRMALAVVALGSPAFADCEDLWFSRNAVFDQAGFCFGSTLGQSVFDNSDCTTTSPEISEREKALVARIKAQERNLDCRIDTARSQIEVADLEQRRGLMEQPVADGFESACIGWKAAVYDLRLAPFEDAPEATQIRPGDMLLLRHEGTDGFDFVTVLRDGNVAGLGWMSAPIDETTCSDFAG